MPPAKKKKIFVLDTNVILHDSSCIYRFEENDIVIPISVIEELDKFKKGNDTLNFHARHFLRDLDALSEDNIFAEGVKIAPKLGNVMVRLDCQFHEDLGNHFPKDNPDHHILNNAYCIAKEKPNYQVVLVTKDVNLRMKAKAVHLHAEDYTSDHIKSPEGLYTGWRTIEEVDDSVISALYKDPGEIDPEKVADNFMPNEYLILKCGTKSALAWFDPMSMTIKALKKYIAYGITPRNAEQTFAMHALMNPNVPLITISGRAGTGKTLLALATALENKKMYRQICVARPVVPLSNKDLGFLPGDIGEKLAPYMQPLYDNLGVIQNRFVETDSKFKKIEELLEEEKLLITPLAYIRGRSLVNIFFIVDEAQNLTPHEIKTIITRAGENTKIIFTGDIYQIDHPYLDTYSNGLSHLIDKMRGQKLYAHINLEKGERSQLSEMASNLL